MAKTRWIPAKPDGPGYLRAAEGWLPVDGSVPRHLVKVVVSAFLDAEHIGSISKAVMAALTKQSPDSDTYKLVVAMTEPSAVFTTDEVQEDKVNKRWRLPFVAYVYDAAKQKTSNP